MTFPLGAIGTFTLLQTLYAGPGGIFGVLARVESLRWLWGPFHAFMAGAEGLGFHAVVT